MDIKDIKTKIKEVRELSKKRNFSQNFDLVINLQNMDLKKPGHKVDLGVTLSHPIKSKKLKICSIIDHGISGAEDVFDKVIYNDDLLAMKGNMEKIRAVIHSYDKFVVQANLMPIFAQILGRYLGPMNKMPSPKLGMIINPKTPLKELFDKIQKTVHVQTKKNLVLQMTIGSETESDEVIAEDIEHIFTAVVHALPNQLNNLKNVNLKLTMGKKVTL